MAPSRPRTLAATVLVAISLPVVDAHAQGNKPTALEMAQLPRFCYWQYEVPNATGDEFRIRDCGPAANHYCSGLMYMIRAKAVVGNKRARIDLLGHADVDIRYTEKAIKDYPKCSIRESVMKSRIEVNNLLYMYGGKPLPPVK